MFYIFFLILVLVTSQVSGSITIFVPSPITRGQSVTVSYTRASGDPLSFLVGTQGEASFEVQSDGQTAWRELYPVSAQFPIGNFVLEAFPLDSDGLVGSGATLLGVSNEFTVLDQNLTTSQSSATPQPSTTPQTSSVPSSSPTPQNPSSSSKIPAIIGGVIGGVIVLAILTFLMVRRCLFRQRKDSNPQLSVQQLPQSHIAPFESATSESSSEPSNRFREKRQLLQERRDEVARLQEQLDHTTSSSASLVEPSSGESSLVLELRRRIQELTELLAPPPGYEEGPKP